MRAHDIRLIDHGDRPRILFDLVVPSDFKATDQELQIRIQEQVYRNIGDYPVEVTFDHIYLL